MIAQQCEATLWTSAQVRRWLENEGYKDLWPFLEPDAPVTGQDLLSLSCEDWHRLFKHYSDLPTQAICDQSPSVTYSLGQAERHTGVKIHILSKSSHIENPNFYKHLSEISFFTKITFLKTRFQQNSHF